MIDVTFGIVRSGSVVVVVVAVVVIRRNSSVVGIRRNGSSSMVVGVRRLLIVVVVEVMMTGSGHGNSLRSSVDSSTTLISVIAIETAGTNFGRDGVHVVEVAVEEVSGGEDTILVFVDGLASLGVSTNTDVSVTVFAVHTIDAGDTTVLLVLFGFVLEVDSGVVVEGRVVGEVVQEILAISTLAGGVVFVSLRGVFHGDVRSSTESSHVIFLDDVVIVVVVVVTTIHHVVVGVVVFTSKGVEDILVSGGSFLVVVVVRRGVGEARHYFGFFERERSIDFCIFFFNSWLFGVGKKRCW